MLKEKLAFLVYACTRHAWAVIALSAIVTVLCGVYAARHFAIDTDINKLISADLSWRQQEIAFARAFPQRYGTIFAVVDAPTAEQASLASAALARTLHHDGGRGAVPAAADGAAAGGRGGVSYGRAGCVSVPSFWPLALI
jgi:hypothetical protein